jgi:alpha-tubulin suppressor-like RCC1 family protein
MRIVDKRSRARWATVAAAALVTASLTALGAPAAAHAVHAAPAAKPKPKPTVTSVFNNAIHAPSAAIAGGARITVTGTHFKNVQKVTFGKLAGKKLHVVSPRKLQVTVPAHAPGLVHVRVVTKSGKSRVSPHDRFYFQIRRRLAGGYEHSCQALATGIARCWGYNHYGQLGDGDTVDSVTPAQVMGLSKVVSVAAGYYHSCALLAGGAVKCWGDNFYGQLGNNSTTDSSTPVQVLNLGPAVAITVGAELSCALIVGGKVKCWGQNTHGALGDNSTTTSLTPVLVHNLNHVVDIGAGQYHVCATKADGTEWCWGGNQYGQLGDTSTTDRLLPTKVTGVKHAVATAVGDSTSCILNEARKVSCWGYGSEGERGDGTTTATQTRPVAVSGLSNVARLAYGYYNGCVVLASGGERCWGYNEYGEVGDGSSGVGSDALTPRTVAQLNHVADLGVGYYHSLAVVKNGATKAWGYNNHGQLGDGTATDSPTPVTVV